MKQGMSNGRAAFLGITAVVIGLVMLVFFRPTGHTDAFWTGRFFWWAGGFILIGLLILVLAALDALRNRRGRGDGQ